MLDQCRMDHDILFLSEPLKTEKKIPWTVARCNRLLRPLTSKLAALERTRARAAIETNTKHGPGARLSSTQGLATELSAGESDSCDIFARSQKNRRTYAGHQARKRAAFGPRDRAALDRATTGLPSSSRRVRLPRDGIVEAYMRVLAATRIDASHKRPNAPQMQQRSLFTACLHKVPAAIEDEQTLRHALDPDDKSDVQNEIWSALEDFGTMGDCGWEPLRVLVQAQSTHVVARAVERGFLSGLEICDLDQALQCRKEQPARIAIFNSWLVSPPCVNLLSASVDTDQLHILFSHIIPLLPEITPTTLEKLQNILKPHNGSAGPSEETSQEYSWSHINPSSCTWLVKVARIVEERFTGMGFRLERVTCDHLLEDGADAMTLQALELAMSIEQEMPFGSDLYSHEIERRIQHKRLVKQADFGDTDCSTAATLKWDGGLCEWINGTPVQATQARRSTVLKELPSTSNRCNGSVVVVKTPCKRKNRETATGALDDDDEDELSVQQSGRRGMGERTNKAWYGWKKIKT